MGTLKHIHAGDLSIAHEESGNVDGTIIILLHGFPYDIRAYDEVTKHLLTKTVGLSFHVTAGSTPEIVFEKLKNIFFPGISTMKNHIMSFICSISKF
jgi:hypothetical protein